MDDELTPALRRVWELHGAPASEPKAGLSVERVVRAAVELADEQGLAAVSMARVARRLGFTTMSLYRHVASKDELLLLMADAALAQPPSLAGLEGDWRAGLERWSQALVAALSEHPWFLHVPITGPPSAPTQVAWFDRGLEALAGTALSESEKASSVLMLNAHAFWQARVETEIAAAAHARGVGVEAAVEGYAATLSALATAQRFPSLRRALDAGIFDDDDIDDFAFGLQLALDGIAGLVERRGGGRKRPARSVPSP
ncbi:TetR/AcrR family transcriptional regulator [Conexibacter woesei]|uniref:Transcriptional regulator, TetR family n=1 Tax=Conexibacter woesei (strain DSM 14684 / CCUG 47730 / CIP 108061 / JCM 11494 / NBRC 100937 / ID131577) TaxID=469383 RepID=D3F5Q4_CONWI|nr:helix-turn-helix domain-containing protein [Conexibacter woesei]ADB52603.1 transcriptional regulator, TetR family [Conexibacter woesei DSM 14684]